LIIAYECPDCGRFHTNRAECYEVKGCLAQVNADRMYLHIDDPPCQKAASTISLLCARESNGGPSHSRHAEVI
jgi:hypothetical protein